MQLNFIDLNQPVANIITQLKSGEKCLIIKEGKPIAEILPLKKTKEGWKRKINLSEKGIIDKYIEEELNL